MCSQTPRKSRLRGQLSRFRRAVLPQLAKRPAALALKVPAVAPSPLKSLPANLAQTFKVSLDQLNVLLSPQYAAQVQADSFTLTDSFAWTGSRQTLWQLLAYGEVLLELLNIETVTQTAQLTDCWGRALQLMRGTGVARTDSWVELPRCWHDDQFVVWERLYWRGRLRYLALLFGCEKDTVTNLRVNVQLTVTLAAPRMRLLYVPMLEQYIEKIKLCMKLFAASPLANELASKTRSPEQYHLQLQHHWQREFAPRAAAVRHKDPKRYYDFLFPRPLAHTIKLMETTWRELQRFHAHAAIKPRLPSGAALTAPLPATQKTLQAIRHALLQFCAALPQTLQLRLPPRLLSNILSVPEDILLTIFAEGCECHFFALALSAVCPYCCSPLALNTGLLTAVTETQRLELQCPFCHNAFNVLTADIACKLQLQAANVFSARHVLPRATGLARQFAATQLELQPLPAQTVIVQATLSANVWTRVLTLPPGRYRLLSHGRHPNSGLDFIMEAAPPAAAAPPLPTLPLIRTQQGQLTHIAAVDEASSPIPVFIGAQLKVVVENNVSVTAPPAVLRLQKVTTSQPPPAALPLAADVLSLEHFFPYLLKHAPQTLRNLCTQENTPLQFAFKRLPLLLCKGLPAAAGTPDFLEQEAVWTARLRAEPGVTWLPGFTYQWLCLLPNEVLGLRLALETFAYFYKRALAVKLVYISGAGKFFTEPEPQTTAQPGYPYGRLQGAVYHAATALLKECDSSGLILSAASVSTPVMEKWLRTVEQVDIKRLPLSKQIRAELGAETFYWLTPARS